MAPAVARQAAFHLLLCCYALGDTEGMKAAFERLITCDDLPHEGDDSASDGSDDEGAAEVGPAVGRGAWGGGGGSGGIGRGSERPGDRLREDVRRRRALVQE